MSLRLAILGHPIGHSLSPLFHMAALEACGMTGSYELLDIRPEALNHEWREHLSGSYDGFNVTTPHKVSALSLCGKVTDEARSVGAVNTLIRSGSVWHGSNTDLPGITASLLPHWDRLEGSEVTILGAGGAARAVLAALSAMTVPSSVHIINRDILRASQLEAAFRGSIPVLDCMTYDDKDLAGIVSRSTLVVHCTTVGMYPDTQARLLEGMNVFRSGQIVFDLIYHPRETRLLRDARGAGATVIDGLEMFLQQAAASFELWSGVRPPVPEIRPLLERALATS